MHLGKGDKYSKTKCAFFPPPVFLERKLVFPFDDGDMDEGLLVPKRKQESYEGRQKIEELAYGNLSRDKADCCVVPLRQLLPTLQISWDMDILLSPRRL